MLFYGLHPLLVESVVWIGYQFELKARHFMLLRWIASPGIAAATPRIISIAICFFLFACSKESTLAFRFIIVAFHWLIQPEPHTLKLIQLRTLLIRNWAADLAILPVAVAYLALRHRVLGMLIPDNRMHPLPLWVHLQEVSFLYLRYWQMFFWPTVGMVPMHSAPTHPFPGFGVASILLAATLLALRRMYIGGLVLCTTFAPLPPLHIVGLNFDQSL